jgi:hypothetical protein
LADLAEGLQLLDRVGEVTGTHLHLVEQAHVVDGDYGLIGEGLQDAHLLVRKRPHLGSADHDRSDGLALPHKRRDKDGPVPKAKRLAMSLRVFVADVESVIDVDGPSFEDGPPGHPPRSERPTLEVERNRAAVCGDLEPLAFLEEDDGIIGAA